MKIRLSVIISIVILLSGLAIYFYPTVADYWNTFTQTKAIQSYSENVDNLNREEYSKILDEARAYNEEIAKKGICRHISDEEKAKYNAVLNPDGKGMMAYIEIPKINVVLGIYHGADEKVLLRSAGHIEGSSLPVDSESAHCIISGHRGLPSASLFSELDKLATGDKFMIRTLNEVYTYEVDSINIVEPDDISLLKMEKGKNYCTLVTCTPYGSNTHRLLVRGQMTDTKNPPEIMIPAEAMQIKPVYIAAFIAVPILVLIVPAVMIFNKKPHKPDTERLKGSNRT